MRAELVIHHRPGDLVAALQPALGANNAAALATSAFARKSPSSAAAIAYSAYGPGLCVLAWPTPGQLFLYVESKGGRLRKAADVVWGVVRSGGAHLEPQLQDLVLFDEDANDQIASAAEGFMPNIRRRELALAFAIGAASAAWLIVALIVFDATGDLVLGAVPTLIYALLAGIVLLRDVRAGKLVWR